MLELASKTWPSMEGVAHHFYHHYYYRNHRLLCKVWISPTGSPSGGHYRRRANSGSAPPARLGLVVGDLRLRRVSQAKTSNINARFKDPRFSFRFLNLNSWKRMATKNDGPKAENLEKKERHEEEVEEEIKKEAKKKSPPPPPEMPEPGDCCGSGCVRCVWDVYYEELEAYNKLYVDDSNTSNSRPS